MSLERSEMMAALEALLFASDTPVSLETLCDVLGCSEQTIVKSCLDELMETYSSDGRGLQVFRVAGGYHIRTRGECSPWVERLLRRRKKMRLSQAALETLAIVAYKQPVTKVEIESIRGVDSGGVLGTLLERNLVAIKGRSKGPGRPLLYCTTSGFLDQFGLNDLEDLPSLEELESLMARREEIMREEEEEGGLSEEMLPEEVTGAGEEMSSEEIADGAGGKIGEEGAASSEGKAERTVATGGGFGEEGVATGERVAEEDRTAEAGCPGADEGVTGVEADASDEAESEITAVASASAGEAVASEELMEAETNNSERAYREIPSLGSAGAEEAIASKEAAPSPRRGDTSAEPEGKEVTAGAVERKPPIETHAGGRAVRGADGISRREKTVGEERSGKDGIGEDEVTWEKE